MVFFAFDYEHQNAAESSIVVVFHLTKLEGGIASAVLNNYKMKRKAQETLFVSGAKATKYELTSHGGEILKTKHKKKKKQQHEPIVALTGVKKLMCHSSTDESKRKRNRKPKNTEFPKQSRTQVVVNNDKNTKTMEKSSSNKDESFGVVLQNHQKCKLGGDTCTVPIQMETNDKMESDWSGVQLMKKKPSPAVDIIHSSVFPLGKKEDVMISKKKNLKKKHKSKDSNWTKTKDDILNISGDSFQKYDSKKVMKSKRKTKQLKDGLIEKSAAVDKILLPKSSEEYSVNWKKFMASAKKRKGTEQKVQQKTIPMPDKQEVPDIWFDDVDNILIETLKPKSSTDNSLVKPFSFEGVTKIVAMDCEMVGVGQNGEENMLARVSIVNQHGQCLYDKFVKPMEEIVDYRTSVSGVRPENLVKGEVFTVVQKEVADIIKGKILVGHAIHNDFKVLYLNHPKKMIRDTSYYKPFRRLFGGRKPSLKKLSDQILNVQVQQGEHNSVQDSQAAMRLYTMHRQQWEKEIKTKRHKIPRGGKKGKSCKL